MMRFADADTCSIRAARLFLVLKATLSAQRAFDRGRLLIRIFHLPELILSRGCVLS
jgi:hypothetical protein